MDKVYTKALVLDYKIDFRVEKVQVRLYLTNVSNALTAHTYTIDLQIQTQLIMFQPCCWLQFSHYFFSKSTVN